MTGDGDDFGEDKTYHILFTERHWEIPRAPRRRIGEKLQLIVRKDETPPCVALARQSRSPRRLPTIERHRESNHDVRVSRRVRELLKRVENGPLFRSHI
jgi:hypothetical protein